MTRSAAGGDALMRAAALETCTARWIRLQMHKNGEPLRESDEDDIGFEPPGKADPVGEYDYLLWRQP